MPLKPRADLAPNTLAFETTPLVKPTGFREYDARWWLGFPAATVPRGQSAGRHGTRLGFGASLFMLSSHRQTTVVAKPSRSKPRRFVDAPCVRSFDTVNYVDSDSL